MHWVLPGAGVVRVVCGEQNEVTPSPATTANDLPTINNSLIIHPISISPKPQTVHNSTCIQQSLAIQAGVFLKSITKAGIASDFLASHHILLPEPEQTFRLDTAHGPKKALTQ